MDIDAFCQKMEERLCALTDPQTRLTAAVDLLGEAFRVQPDEVAIFTRRQMFDQEVLCFLWPKHLAESASSYVPLTSENSLAVQTFLKDRPFINLTFASTPHASYFEMVPSQKNSGKRPPPIQKTISAPAKTEGGFQGVIQVCHKGGSLEEAGKHFAPQDLERLKRAATVMARHL